MKALSKLLPEEHVVSWAAFQAFSKPVGKYGNSVCIKVQTRSDYFHIVEARKSTRFQVDEMFAGNKKYLSLHLFHYTIAIIAKRQWK